MLRSCQNQEANEKRASPALPLALCQRLGRSVQMEEKEDREGPPDRIKGGCPIKWGTCPFPVLFKDLKTITPGEWMPLLWVSWEDSANVWWKKLNMYPFSFSSKISELCLRGLKFLLSGYHVPSSLPGRHCVLLIFNQIIFQVYQPLLPVCYVWSFSVRFPSGKGFSIFLKVWKA